MNRKQQLKDLEVEIDFKCNPKLGNKCYEAIFSSQEWEILVLDSKENVVLMSLKENRFLKIC